MVEMPLEQEKTKPNAKPEKQKKQKFDKKKSAGFEKSVSMKLGRF